jgi:hypothetical protein
LSGRSGRGSDGEPEHRSQRAAYVDKWVHIGNRSEEVWTDRPGVNRFPVLDLDVSDAEVREKIKTAVGRGEGVGTEERIGKDTNLKYDGTDDLSVD